MAFDQLDKKYLNNPHITSSSDFAVPAMQIDLVKLKVLDLISKWGYKIFPPHLGSIIHCDGDRENFYLIDPFLDVYKCSASAGSDKLRAGHLSDSGEMIPTSFYYEWESRDPTEIEGCRDCWALPVCAGGCKHGLYTAKYYHGIPLNNICAEPELAREYLRDEYVKLYLKQRYPDKLKNIKIDESTRTECSI